MFYIALFWFTIYEYELNKNNPKDTDNCHGTKNARFHGCCRHTRAIMLLFREFCQQPGKNKETSEVKWRDVWVRLQAIRRISTKRDTAPCALCRYTIHATFVHGIRRKLHYLDLLWIFSRPYLSNGRAIGMVVVVCLSVCNGCLVVKL